MLDLSLELGRQTTPLFRHIGHDPVELSDTFDMDLGWPVTAFDRRVLAGRRMDQLVRMKIWVDWVLENGNAYVALTVPLQCLPQVGDLERAGSFARALIAIGRHDGHQMGWSAAASHQLMNRVVDFLNVCPL